MTPEALRRKPEGLYERRKMKMEREHTKVLDFEAVRAIAAETPDSELIRWVDEALREKSGYTLPPKIHISQQDGDYYNVMPCIYERGNLAMVKMIGRHGIKSARLFTRPDFETVGLIGLGDIMTVCIRAFIASLRAEGDRRAITLKLIRYHGHENRIMDLFRQDPDVHFVLCDTYEEVIGGSDLVISAITKVTENFVTDEYFKEGCTVIPICTMGFQNCDLFFDRVFTDEIEQIRGFKYFDHFAPVTTNVTDVLNGAAPGRTDNVQRILVYNYGIAIHDLVFAANIYGRAAVPDTPYHYCRKKYFI